MRQIGMIGVPQVRVGVVGRAMAITCIFMQFKDNCTGYSQEIARGENLCLITYTKCHFVNPFNVSAANMFASTCILSLPILVSYNKLIYLCK